MNGWKRAGILLLVFVFALVGSSLILNRGTEDQTVGLGDPTLPQISFMVADQPLNELAGYTSEMDITAMRDTITPVDGDGILTMNLQRNNQEIKKLGYELYSLDGETTYTKKQIKDVSATNVDIDVSAAFSDSENAPATEAVLKVIMETEEEEVINFYTRVEKIDGLALKECLTFAQDFHQKAINGDGSTLAELLEPGEDSDNTTLQTVNIHSNLTHVQWGDLKPEAITDVAWSIKESNSTYTSLLAKYQVTSVGDSGEKELYNVKEFFRVRSSQDKMYLLDYNRTMNQVFNGNHKILDENSMLLGMVPDDVEYMTNKKGTIVAFVQERELWCFDTKTGNLSMLFSFTNSSESSDSRNRNDEHDVRIISVDENGNITFTVNGYMNRGAHEGKVGVNVYYFDAHKNVVNEIAFIPSMKSYVIAKDELGKMVYYSQKDEILYVLAGGVLYQVDVPSGRQKELAENLSEGQYVASEDGHLLAYQLEGDLNSTKDVRIMNLETQSFYEVSAPEDAFVRPLGFITDDFICGYLKDEDKGTTLAGEEVAPMYGMEIFGFSEQSGKKSLKKYTQEGIYVSDILVEDSLVTVNRVTKSGQTYTNTSQDYITSNEKRETSGVSLETFSSKIKEKQYSLVFEEELKYKQPKILYPKLVDVEKSATITFEDKKKTNKYYVYGMGELVGVYDKAAYAIQKAEQVSGVVISSEQAYVWEKGNRDLEFYTDTQPFKKGEGQTSYEACMSYMEQFGAKRMDLTGCTLNQVLYIINKGMPVIAMTDSTHAMLLMGYGLDTVTYIDTDSGEMRTISQKQMSEMTAEAGNAFVGFSK